MENSCRNRQDKTMTQKPQCHCTLFKSPCVHLIIFIFAHTMLNIKKQCSREIIHSCKCVCLRVSVDVWYRKPSECMEKRAYSNINDHKTINT